MSPLSFRTALLHGQLAWAAWFAVVPPALGVTGAFEPIKESRCENPLKVSFFGDLYIHERGLDQGNALFRGVAPLLKWADYNVVNFEGVVTSSTLRAFPTYPFALKMPPEVPGLLAREGITHVTRSNNHSMDYGLPGITDTDEVLERAKIAWAGTGINLMQALRPMTLEGNGVRVALLSFTTTLPDEGWAEADSPGVAPGFAPLVQKAVKQAAITHDYTLAIFHWGTESSPAVHAHQRELARVALESGARLVLGHHAHVAQTVEMTGDDVQVIYGLGNFIFTSLTDNSLLSLGAHVEFCKVPGPLMTTPPQVVLTPLDTLTTRTQYRTAPYTFEGFAPVARRYSAAGHFPPQTPFHVPETGLTKPLWAWLFEVALRPPTP